VRLFIAIDLPPEIKRELAELSRALERQADAGRAIPPENFHLTLVFIGETARLREVCEVMDVICRRELSEPLRLALGGIGSFKGRGGRGRRGKGRGGHSWWVGVEAAPDLDALALALADGLREAGFAIEKRNFKPHITIGRNVVTSRPIELHLPPIELAAATISLMRSDRKNNRQVYTELHTCPVTP
jgi:2'-5' RNA ligase